MLEEGQRSRAIAPKWPELDGLRAFAVVTVMIFHMFIDHVMLGGYLGVDVFFVLSGFLITSLLVGEWEKHGGVHFGYFYARRALRLLPALIAVVVLGTVAVLAFDQLSTFRHGTLTSIPWCLFFIENWRRALPQVSASTAAVGLFGHTWSLSIEEQFYLIWPPTLVFLLSRWKGAKHRQHLALAMFGLALIEMVWRFVVDYGPSGVSRAYFGTDTHSDGLLIGSAVALWLSTESARYLRQSLLLKVAAFVGCVTLSGLVLASDNYRPWGSWLSISLVNVFTGIIIVAVVCSRVPFFGRILSWRFVTWTGKRSYGLYLWHYPIYQIFSVFQLPGSHHRVETYVAEFVVSFVVAGLSWRYLEAPLNRYRKKFQRFEEIPAELGSLKLGAT
jgi:peptidoglycan/LPS O-acetylase OafA/YrhL